MHKRRFAIRVVAFVLIFTFMLFPSYGEGKPLVDIQGHWAEYSIMSLASRGIVNGYPDGSYRPEQNISRAEFAKLLTGALGLESEAWELNSVASTFRDVPRGHWALPYIELAYERKFVSGYQDGSFRPESNLSRVEAAAILVRVLGLDWGDTTLLQKYSDNSEVPSWAAAALAAAVQHGLLTGYADKTLKPLKPVTRAEIAALLLRLMTHRGDQFDFYVLATGLDNGLMSFELAGEKYELELELDAAFYRGNKQITAGELSGYLPSGAYLNLGAGGKISFVDLAGSVKNDLKLSSIRQKTASSGTTPGKDNLGMLLERKMDDTETRSYLQQAGQSLDITRNETGISAFSSLHQVDGSGTLIALVDTGIDPGHPDLLRTTGGDNKVLDWLDLTGEGLVKLTGVILGDRNYFTVDGQRFDLGSLAAAGTAYRYGFFREDTITMDINFDGDREDRFLVLAVQDKTSRRFDRVYLDTDQDGNLGEEKPLKVYREGGEYLSFPTGEQGAVFNVILSELDSQGSELKLGFDANGHGTHVAGVAAANGKSKGMAPGAQLLIIKALDKNGTVEWELLKNALREAAWRGADIVSLSLGYYPDATMGYNTLTELMDDLSREYGTIFTVASGNNGPGIESLATPGNGEAAIGVGAYISPEMWLNDYGYRVRRDSLWYFSSIGPRQDGYLAPTIVAPGSAVAAAPLWSGHSYYLGEGTSVAAPHVAGAVALLLEAAAKNGMTISPQKVKEAIAQGASPIPHLSIVEAGHGKLELGSTWEQLKRFSGTSPLQALTYNGFLGFGPGLYARNYIPGELDLRVANSYPTPLRAFWLGSEAWIKPLADQTQLPAGGVRNLPVEYRLPEEPGLYSAWIRAYVPQIGGMKLEVPVTAVRPVELTGEVGYRMEDANFLEAGQLKRYFFQIPEGAGNLDISLAVPTDSDGVARGRLRLHLIRPDGSKETTTDYIGLNSPGVNKANAGVSIADPMPGIWEVVVYSSASLSLYGRQDSYYRLSVQLRDVKEVTASNHLNWLITALPREAVPGQPVQLVLQVRRIKDLEPVNGTLEVNGRLYHVRNGRLAVKLESVGQEFELVINK